MKKHGIQAVCFFLLFVSMQLLLPSKQNMEEGKSRFYIEAGGSCIFLSVNYEYFFSPEVGLHFGGSVVFPGITGSLVFLQGKKNAKFEIGLGATWAGLPALFHDGCSCDSDWDILPFGVLGLRYHTSKHRTFYRFVITAMQVPHSFIIIPGISIGW